MITQAVGKHHAVRRGEWPMTAAASLLARAQGQTLGGLRCARPLFQFLSLLVRQRQRLFRASCTHEPSILERPDLFNAFMRHHTSVAFALFA